MCSVLPFESLNLSYPPKEDPPLEDKKHPKKTD